MFNLFLNDLQEAIEIDLDTLKLFVLLFADDLVLFAETVIELQRMINRLAVYCDMWHIKVNAFKTKVIVFRNGGPLRNYERLKFKYPNLEVVTYYKYLVLLLSSFMCQKSMVCG